MDRLAKCLRLVALLFTAGLALVRAETPSDNEPLWSLLPLAPPALPDPNVHPIDAFVDAKLDAHQLRKAPRAHRRSLVRRLSYGLKGLPPTDGELAEFLLSKDDRAYEMLIERYLASPQYGEHWGRHWLDIAQYADTHGNDHDYRRPNAWPYRDYVIQAFNADKPYPRFIKEQIAGDALYPNSPVATIATGFLAAGPWDDTLMITIRPDTIDHRMGQNLDRDSLVSTVMNTFQSLTVHCARCHDHKFDPISQKDYYALQAVFAGCDRADRPVDNDPAVHGTRARLRELNLSIQRRDPKLLARLPSLEFATKISTLKREVESPRWSLLEVSSIESSVSFDETRFTRESDHSWFVSGKRSLQDTFEIVVNTTLPKIRAFRLEVLPDPRLPAGGPGRADNGNFHLGEFRVHLRTPSGDKQRFTFTKAVADHSDGIDAITAAIDRNADSFWSINPQYNKAHDAVFALTEPAQIQRDAKIRISLQFSGKNGHQIGRFRLWASADELGPRDGLPPRVPEKIMTLLRKPTATYTLEEQRTLALYVIKQDTLQQLADLPKPSQFVYAVSHDFPKQNGFEPALVPRPIHRLRRGDLTQPLELVAPATLNCLPELPGDLEVSNQLDESSRRAALARWIADKRNVLTWRSIVNRVWHWHFGQGICSTPNDFGTMGQPPSHPELLDWLAIWFRDKAKGSFKELHRLILTSETYRQGVINDPQHRGNEIDSANRFLWRMNRQRLSAEQVRDSVLQFAGALNTTMGGPPVLHFLHKGDQTFMNSAPPFVDYANFDPSSIEGHRRAIYRFIFRTVPDPLFDALGCPDGSGTVPVRDTSSTTQQALALLNDPFLLHHSQRIAERIREQHPKAITDQVHASFQLILQRPVSARELEAVLDYVASHGLANFCHLLLNTNEFLFLD